MGDFNSLAIAQLSVREVPKMNDSRGFFQEIYREVDFSAFSPRLVQDNLSYSKGSVLRGMHFQDEQWQILTVLSGSILDVTIDISRSSKTFLQSQKLIMGDGGLNQLIIPPKVAHGFCVLSDEVYLLYKSSKYYGDSTQHGISWNSEQIIDLWPDKDWVLSKRDLEFTSLNEFLVHN